MARKRPCGVCSTWFYPNPRQGEQQHTCGRPDCRKEWHRRACAKWHGQNPYYDAHTRLVRRLVKDEAPEQRGRHPDLGDDTVWSASATTTPVHGVALNRAVS